MITTKHLVTIDGHPTLVDAEYTTTDNCSVKNMVLKNIKGVDVTALVQPKAILSIRASAKKKCIDDSETIEERDDIYNSALLSLDDEIPLSYSTDVYRTGKMRLGALGSLEELLHTLDVDGSVRILESSIASPSKIVATAGDGILKMYDIGGLMLKSDYDPNNNGFVDSAGKIEGVDGFSTKKYYGTDENGNPGFFDGGADGQDGAPGAQGDPGVDGVDGDSAYQIWLNNSNTGTEQDYLDSLIGADGADGAQGIQGIQGVKGDKGDQGDPGVDGAQGIAGVDGDDGLSAYEVWVNNGNSGGTVNDYLNAIKGADGAQGPQGFTGAQGPVGETGMQGIQGVKGDKGDQGDQGIQGVQGIAGNDGVDGQDGADGDSAYDIWIAEGNMGTEADFLSFYQNLWTDDGDGSISRDSDVKINKFLESSIKDDYFGVRKMLFPKKATYRGNGNQTGAIKIKLPVSWTAGISKFQIEITGYNPSRTCTVIVNGHNTTAGGGFWHGSSKAMILSNENNTNFTVRLGHDGTTCCIIIGDVTSVWSFLQVAVTNVMLGHGSALSPVWETDWEVSLITTLPSNIDVALTDNLPYAKKPSLWDDEVTHIERDGDIEVRGSAIIDDFVDSSIMRAEIGVGANRTLRRVLFPKGGAYSFAGNKTGYMKITLPVGYNNTMLSFTIQIYNYLTNRSALIHVGGYITTFQGGIWFRTSAQIITGDQAMNYTVRFGSENGKCCVLLGESNTAWIFPQLAVVSVQLGYNGSLLDNYVDGWSIEAVTDLPTDVTAAATLTNALPLAKEDKWITVGVHMHAKHGSNVAIGYVGTPTRTLDVYGTAKFGKDAHASNHQNWHTVLIGANTTNDRASILFNPYPASNGNDGMGIQYTKSVGGLQFVDWSAPAVRMTLLKNGFLGIGVIPTEKLHVDGNGWITGNLTVLNTFVVSNSAIIGGAITVNGDVNLTGLLGDIAPTKVLTINASGGVRETPISDISTIDSSVCFVKDANQLLNATSWTNMTFDSEVGGVASISGGVISVDTAGLYTVSYVARLICTGSAANASIEFQLYTGSAYRNSPIVVATIPNVDGVDKASVNLQFTFDIPANTDVHVRFRRIGTVTDDIRLAGMPYPGNGTGSASIGVSLENNRMDIVKIG